MDAWQLALYAFAAVLALRSLAGLMIQHQRDYRARLLAEEEQRRRAEKAKAKKAAQEQKAPRRSSNGAAA